MPARSISLMTLSKSRSEGRQGHNFESRHAKAMLVGVQQHAIFRAATVLRASMRGKTWAAHFSSMISSREPTLMGEPLISSTCTRQWLLISSEHGSYHLMFIAVSEGLVLI